MRWPDEKNDCERPTNWVTKRSRDCCWYCGEELVPGVNRSIDHIVPRSRGGSNDVRNLIGACKPCNARKADMTVEEFRARFQITTFWGENQGRRISRLINSPDLRRLTRIPSGTPAEASLGGTCD